MTLDCVEHVLSRFRSLWVEVRTEGPEAAHAICIHQKAKCLLRGWTQGLTAHGGPDSNGT